MKLTHEEFLRLSESDKQEYIEQNGESFDVNLTVKTGGGAAPIECEYGDPRPASKPFIKLTFGRLLAVVVLLGILILALGGITFFLFYGVLVFVFFVAIYNLATKQEKELIIKNAKIFLEDVNSKKALTPCPGSVFTDSDERIFCEADADMSETRAVREYAGSSVRIASGFYIHSGGSESTQEWTSIDKGIITITNKRLIFTGAKVSRNIPIKKLLTVDYSTDHVEISAQNLKKKIRFKSSNPLILGINIRICRMAADPGHLTKEEIGMMSRE